MSSRSRIPKGVGPLAAFGVVALVTAIFLVSLLGGRAPVDGEEKSYKAQFTDASYLLVGDEVRISGVPVGNVKSVELAGSDGVLVTFTARTEGGLPAGVRAAIRYKDLLGARYLELLPPAGEQEMPGSGSAGERAEDGSHLDEGDTIPVARTQPAVDLDALTGGFKPLFKALDADQINTLSGALIAVLQDEGGSVETLLNTIASFTSTLADNDKVIGDLITELDLTVSEVASRNDNLDTTIVQLQQLITGLKRRSLPIAQTVSHLNDLTAETATLLHALRPPTQENIASIRGIATELNDGKVKVNAALAGLGDALDMIAGIGVYGDFYNFYVCDIRVRFTGANGEPAYTPWINSNVPRCSGRPTGD